MMIQSFRRHSFLLPVAASLLLLSTSVHGQPPRIGRADTQNDSLNRILNDSPLVPQPLGGLNRTNEVDLSRIDSTAVRNLVADAVSESTRLYRSLETDFRRYPQLRPYLQELLTLRARASRLQQDLEDRRDMNLLLPSFQQLDSDWHLLSHRLGQSRGLSNQTTDIVDRIDRIGQQMQQLFQMEPQLDRRALLSEMSMLQSALRSITEELELDPNLGAGAYNLMLETRKLTQQASLVQDAVLSQADYTTIVREFNHLNRMLTTVKPELNRIANRYVQRNLATVADASNRVHDLLWLEHQADKQRLKQIADRLMQDVDEFYSRTPMKLLLSFSDVNAVLQTADDFYGTVQNFHDVVTRGESDAAVMDAYNYVEDYGRNFVRMFSGIRSSQGRVVLREIEDGVASLQSELNLHGDIGGVDLQKIVPTAASLEALADHLHFDIRQWLNNDRQGFRNEALTASQQFVRRTQRLHSMLQDRPTAQAVNAEVQDLYEEYRVLQSFLRQCRTADREHLARTDYLVREALMELSAPLGF